MKTPNVNIKQKANPAFVLGNLYATPGSPYLYLAVSILHKEYLVSLTNGGPFSEVEPFGISKHIWFDVTDKYAVYEVGGEVKL